MAAPNSKAEPATEPQRADSTQSGMSEDRQRMRRSAPTIRVGDRFGSRIGELGAIDFNRREQDGATSLVFVVFCAILSPVIRRGWERSARSAKFCGLTFQHSDKNGRL